MTVTKPKPELKLKLNDSAWLWGFAGAAVASLAIVGLYIGYGKELLDVSTVQSVLHERGLADPLLFLGLAGYWCFVNSLLEEYVWRWFVLGQAETVTKPLTANIIASFGFTAHHILALAVYCPWYTTALASLGVFIGGFFWGWLYRRSGSIWAAWVSHIIVDIAVFGCGYHLLFVATN